MHTKQQIRSLLLSAGVKPNKRLGQHFLIDLNLMRLLIDSADVRSDDVVLEVGCATGSLTAGIAEKAGCCVAVEIDAVLANIARTQLADKPNVEIIVADALKNKFQINPVVIDALNRARAEHKGRLLLVANLPYAAATPLMLNLITPASCCLATAAGADAMFVTIQKEVANRMTARPACPERSRRGTKDYGILSILLAATGDVRRVRTLKPSVFWPQPQVDSALVSYVRNAGKLKKIKSVEMLSKIAGSFLQHRRKMLKSCCKMLTLRVAGILPANEYNWPEIFIRCGIDPESRPDHLTPEQFVAIANLCCEIK